MLPVVRVHGPLLQGVVGVLQREGLELRVVRQRHHLQLEEVLQDLPAPFMAGARRSIR